MEPGNVFRKTALFCLLGAYVALTPLTLALTQEKARALLTLQAPGAIAEPPNREHDTPSETNTWQEMLRALTGRDLTICPNCGQGRIIRSKLTGNEDALLPPIWD